MHELYQICEVKHEPCLSLETMQAAVEAGYEEFSLLFDEKEQYMTIVQPVAPVYMGYYLSHVKLQNAHDYAYGGHRVARDIAFEDAVHKHPLTPTFAILTYSVGHECPEWKSWLVNSTGFAITMTITLLNPR